MVESDLANFVVNLAINLSASVRNGGKVRFGVGGLFPDPNHAVIGVSDFMYKTIDGNVGKFVTEVKRSAVYWQEDLWYRNSRVCQAIAVMYYSGLPALLHSPAAFKLLLEDRGQNYVYCYPAGNRSGDSRSADF